MTSTRLDPNSTRNPESAPAPTGARKSVRDEGVGSDRSPDEAAETQDPAGPVSPAPPRKITDWESEGGSPGGVISSTDANPPAED